MNNSLEACVLTYVKHQRAAYHEQNSPARTTVRQLCEYYHIRSYPSMMATTSDNQLFGTNLILKTMELVKMIQKLLRSESARKTVMTHLTALNPENPYLVEEPNARSKSLGVHQEEYDHKFMEVCQYSHNNRKSLSDL